MQCMPSEATFWHPLWRLNENLYKTGLVQTLTYGESSIRVNFNTNFLLMGLWLMSRHTAIIQRLLRELTFAPGLHSHPQSSDSLCLLLPTFLFVPLTEWSGFCSGCTMICGLVYSGLVGCVLYALLLYLLHQDATEKASMCFIMSIRSWGPTWMAQVKKWGHIIRLSHSEGIWGWLGSLCRSLLSCNKRAKTSRTLTAWPQESRNISPTIFF